MLTMRDFDGEEFQGKNRSWNNAVFTKDDYIKDKSDLVGLRGRYADYVNEALADSGSHATVSHLTNAENDKEIKHEYQPIAIYQMDKRGVYNEALYSPLVEKQNHKINNAYMATINNSGFQKGLADDWEYRQARRSVEVDTTTYIAPPAIAPPQPQKPSNHLSDFYHSSDLSNEQGLDI